MQYIHIKNLKDYQPGYTDRQHIWAKIYYSILSDDWFQGLCEIDKWRYISLIIFEVFHKKPVALTTANIAFMGWNLKKRSISLTLQMLQSKIDSGTLVSKECTTEENRIDKKREDNICQFLEIFNSFREKFPGTKRGNETEFANFKKQHSDWKEVLPLLEPSLLLQKKDRAAKLSADKWVPPDANLSTWINQSRWEIIPKDARQEKANQQKCVICGKPGSVTYQGKWICCSRISDTEYSDCYKKIMA